MEVSRYPEEWQSLSRPDMRHALLATLDEMLELKVNVNNDGASAEFEIDEIYHFFFDDTDLSSKTNDEPGTILLSNSEITAVHLLTDKLDKLLNQVGDRHSSYFIADQQWPSVEKLARDLKSLLEIHGIPTV